MNDFLELILASICVVVGVAIGNHTGDQATLRDCATKSEAKMTGGGVIECTVRRESK